MAQAATVASPCTGVCTVDRRENLCIGCLRTVDEIAHWRASDDDQRRHILALVAERKADQS